MKRKTLLALLLLLAAFPLHAQFFLSGEDPAHIKWYTLESGHYKLIYPAGLDSLARVYATQLEQFRVPVGRSYGVIPGDNQRKKLPVLLHPFNPYPNGSVSWAPARMDLQTLPNSVCSDPAPWSIQLVSHEPRHQAQLQMGERKYFKAFRYIIGQSWHPVAYQVFLGHALGEGDAVTVETGLWNGTRARTADFLNYYRVALDQGDYRNWFRWRYDSFKHFTPDHYKVGYLTVAGARLLTGNATLMHENAQNASKRPWLLSHSFRSTLKRNGFPRFDDAFRAILDTVNHAWQADALARGPLIPQEQITPDAPHPVFYCSTQMDNNGTLFALRDGFTYAPELVAIRDGNVQHIAYVNGLDTSLAYDPNLNRLYIMEARLHPRWKLAGECVVAYYDINTNKLHDLATGHHYQNPQPSGDGARIAVAEYMPSGENYVVQLSAQDGSVVARTRVPDGYQPTEFGWIGDTLYTSAISVGGYGIYQVTPQWREILAPSVQKVTNMGGDEDYLEWVSDPTGTNEFYRFYPSTGKLLQLTSSRYGVVDVITADKDMIATTTTLNGEHLFRTPLDSLKPREVNFATVAPSFLADTITAQERALGPGPDLSQAVPLSAPKRYYKWGNLLRLHSWLPLYVNYDAVKEGSMDFTYKTASIGLTGFFQNSMGTIYGMAAYSLHRSPDNPANWRNSLHAKLVYTGQYPVFEASLDLGDRAARHHFLNHYADGARQELSTGYFLREAPLVETTFRVYVPLSWHKFGVNYGVIPQVRYTLTNNWLSTEPILWEAPDRFKGLPAHYKLAGVGSDASVLMQRFSASARGYVTLPREENQVFPRWGIGLEAGGSFRPSLDKVFMPSIFGYLYGYLPGFSRTQGIRLTAMVQQQLTPGTGLYFGELGANVLPRGFESDALQAVAQASPFQFKLTADYAIPIYVGDWYIPGVAHIRNFVLTPHGDYMGLSSGNLWSAGADLTAELSKLILPFNSSLGVSFSYLGGTFYANTGQERPWSVELIFGMDF